MHSKGNMAFVLTLIFDVISKKNWKCCEKHTFKITKHAVDFQKYRYKFAFFLEGGGHLATVFY